MDSNVYYTDTDSIFTSVKLPSHLVGPNLGQFKLVDQLKHA